MKTKMILQFLLAALGAYSVSLLINLFVVNLFGMYAASVLFGVGIVAAPISLGCLLGGKKK